MKLCEWCQKNKVEEPYNSCDECVSKRSGRQTKVVDVPTKQDARYFSEGWFRKNHSSWVSDIKSRRQIPGGKIGRFNSKGERVG